MNTEVAPRGVIGDMAAQYRMDPRAFEATLRATVFPADASKEQFAAFLLVAREFNLNPLTKQIYAFPDKRGGVVPIVPIDGWMAIINSHPQFDGMQFVDVFDGAKIVSITCKMFRKDRTHPTEVTEYLSECQKSTEPWKQWPVRMLRHKSAIQCARYAFSLSGIHDPDEADRIIENDITPVAATTTSRGGVDRMKAAMAIAPGAGNAADIEIPTKVAEPEKVAADPLGDQEEQQAHMGEAAVDKSTGEIKERVLTAEELLNAVNAAISKLDEFTDLDAMGDWTAALDNLVKTDMRFTKAFKKNMDRIKAQP